MPRGSIAAAVALALACAATNARAEDAYADATQPASPPLMIAGTAMVILATPATVAGTVLLLGRPSCDKDSPAGTCAHASGLTSAETVGVALLAGGGALFAIGVPLFIVGSRPSAPRTAATPSARVAVGPGSVALGVSF